MPSIAAADPDLSGLSGPTVLVGCGKMGSAMLAGWLRLGLDPAQTLVVDPDPVPGHEGLEAKGIVIHSDTRALGLAKTIVIAVKPQIADAVLATLEHVAGAGTLVISIMAGITTARLRRALPAAVIVRAMPNTPAAIGRGITVAAAADAISPAQRNAADQLLRAVGSVEWVEDESLMDAVTAVSGSGPAYVFLLAESLAAAGEKVGLPRPLALQLARQTVTGSAELLHQSGLDPAELRANVTSPGGTTAAALSVLMGPGGIDLLMERAVAAATQRSRELAGGAVTGTKE